MYSQLKYPQKDYSTVPNQNSILDAFTVLDLSTKLYINTLSDETLYYKKLP